MQIGTVPIDWSGSVCYFFASSLEGGLMGSIMDFRPSIRLSLLFARNSWSIWYAAMFTVPNVHGGVDTLDRPALQVFASLMPFAIRRVMKPDSERAQSVVAERFCGWLAGFCAVSRVRDKESGLVAEDRLLAESRDRFTDEMMNGLMPAFGYIAEDVRRPAVMKLFSELCREFVEWLADKPGQRFYIWPEVLDGAALLLNPSGRVFVSLGKWRRLDPWATDRDVPVTVSTGYDPSEE